MSNIELITKVNALYDARSQKSAKMKFRLLKGELQEDYYPVTVLDFY